MVSKNNIQHKMEDDAKRVPHYGLRKLGIGVASVLLGTTLYFGNAQAVRADATNNAGTSETKTEEQTNVQTGNSVTLQNNGQPSGGNTATNQVASGDNNGSQNGADGASTQSFSVPTNEHPTPANVWESSAVSTLNNNETTENKTVTETINITNPKVTNASIATPPTTNGGFDEATWGKLDVNDWQGQAENGVYQLTGYTGDPSHVIVPNAADFEQAGKSTNGLQVGITPKTIRSLSYKAKTGQRTITFSKTSNQKV